MKLRILLALVFTMFTVGGAYAVQRALFAEPVREVSSASGAQATTGNSRLIPLSTTVESVDGTVQRQTSDGGWVDLRAGEQLEINTVVRTGTGASARLAVGKTLVHVAESTELAVAEQSDKLLRLRLDDGRIHTVVPAVEGSRTRVEVKGSDVRAETAQGDFSVMTRDGGPVSVAVTGGSARVSAKGKDVEVPAGTQSVVPRGEEPSLPVKIPASLLLKLGRVPPQLRTRETLIQGETSPGAVVSLNGKQTTANAAGHFERSVPLEEGENIVKVEVEDTLGQKKSAKLPNIHVDSRPPNVAGKVKW